MPTHYAASPPNWRTIARTDPKEAHEIWVARYDSAKADYLAGALSRDAFASTLYALGFRNSELSAELALATTSSDEQQGED